MMPFLFLFASSFIHGQASFMSLSHGAADRIITCQYSEALGIFGEQLWQSGATLESVSSVLMLNPPTRLKSSLLGILSNTYSKTPIIVDNCFE